MLVFTSCSSTKRVPTAPALVAARVRARSLQGFAREWVARVTAAQEKYTADQVYGGRGVIAAREAALRLAAPLQYVSAGLSVVGQRARIPGYDLTVSAGASCPHPVAAAAATPRAWWGALNAAFGREQPLANAICRHHGIVVLALPNSYLSMVEEDLLALSEKQRQKLRVIVAAGSPVVQELECQAIRYDLRLHGVDGAARGALASFVQRALLHFSQVLVENPCAQAVGAQRRLVETALRGANQAKSPGRSRMSNAQILAWIHRVDPSRLAARSSLLTRYRRSGLACEQARFFALVDATRR